MPESRPDAKLARPRDGVGLDWSMGADGVLRLAGHCDLRAIAGQWRALEALSPRLCAFDLSGLTRLDTAGAYALWRLARGGGVALELPRPEMAALLARVVETIPKASPAPAAPRDARAALSGIGRAVVTALRFGAELATMLGLVLARLGQTLRRPRDMALTALVHHADQVGWRAVPIVALMAFLIGVVLAFQGAVQLRQFGAEIYVVDLIAISILRELGILLTAIIVAGRTASSFTAAIGSMKMREEIDAMRTLAIDPALVLFLPRVLALVITLPILGMIANATGLFGGAMMAWISLDIPPPLFWDRLVTETHPDHVLVGFVKAPVFALIIGIIGCHAGMGVKGNAESLGAQTSSAVVRAIFAVIVADALFSVFFAVMDI